MGSEVAAPSEAARRQDAAWAEWVERAGADSPLPFAEHWARFREIFRDRAAEDGPPIAWRPSPESIAASNLGRFMAERGFDDYEHLHAWSVSQRGDFWRAVIERLEVVFARDPTEVLDSTSGVRAARWLPGAELSCVDSIFSGDPGRAAIVSGREGHADLEVTTYGELERLVNRFARGLIDHGHRPGDPIALYMPMTVECVAAYLGIVRAGCCVVSIADSFSSAEVARRLEIAGARAIVIPQDRAELALREGDILWDELLAPGGEFGSFTSKPDTPINVLFSSGTTGTPKAIPWTHLTPIKCAMDGQMHQDIRPGDIVAWPTNVGWMMGPWLIFATLMNGATMALHNGAPNDPGFPRFVHDAKVTILGVVPALVRAWRRADLVAFDQWERVRVFSSTGEPSNPEDYLWLMSRSGYRAPVIEYLGGTEIGGGHLTGTVVQAASPATFSTPALGIDVVLLDEQGRLVEDAGSGELYLVPPAIGLSQRLLNRDHDEVYYAGCPVGPHGAVLRRHGDRITRLHGGFYGAAGRADDTMNLGGIKVGSLEIEQVLETHEGVRESAAVGVRVEGEAAERLVVFVRLDGEREPDRLRGELASLLATRLNPLFKIHDLVVVSELPRTASNKLMRRKLRDRYPAAR